MLTDRLAKHGIPVIPTNDINRHPTASLPSPDQAELISLGKNLGADLVITGTLTQIGRRISIDLKALDVSDEKPPFSLFMVEDDADRSMRRWTGHRKVFTTRSWGSLRSTPFLSKAISVSRAMPFSPSWKAGRREPGLRKAGQGSPVPFMPMGYFKDVSIETEDGAKGKIVISKSLRSPPSGESTSRGTKRSKRKTSPKNPASSSTPSTIRMR